MTFESRNVILGRPFPATTGEWLDNFGPATGQVIGRIARSNAKDVDAAVGAAATVAPYWASTPVEERAALLDKLAAAVEAQADDFARLESLDTGKPLRFAREIDTARTIANLRFFAAMARTDEMPTHSRHDALSYALRKPLGVVALITPWNLPSYLLSWKLAPALAMGNTVVAKPSELSPLTANRLAQLAIQVGFPPGVFNVIHGLGPEVGEALVRHPEVAAVSFTGGTATGARVAAAAAPRFKKLSLELGGKNPTIVFEDADLDRALEGALRAGFSNTGQICLCGSRLLVQRSIYAEFVGAFAERAAALRVGDPSDEATQVGALISAAHRDKVEAAIERARELGGQVLCGGELPRLPAGFEDGYFVQPTVIHGLPSDCAPATEEIFGPVVTVHPFDDEDEALAIANGVRYGLAASVWTSDLDRAHRMADRLETGMVWINTWLLRDLRVPFGGLKDSGVGREGGRWSLDFFSEARSVTLARG
jgi:aminomuconate-semialdehyde/2-hydroxymuconate-6-semialdehyde dehydrogenase